jgi:hypothetical protein
VLQDVVRTTPESDVWKVDNLRSAVNICTKDVRKGEAVLSHTPPEHEYTPAYDVYMFGALLTALVYLQPLSWFNPTRVVEQNACWMDVRTGDLLKLAARCVNTNPTQRMKTSDILDRLHRM